MKTFEGPNLIIFDTIPISIVGITVSIRVNIFGEYPCLPKPRATIYFPTNYSYFKCKENYLPSGTDIGNEFLEAN
jgi:hypothetical protein